MTTRFARVVEKACVTNKGLIERNYLFRDEVAKTLQREHAAVVRKVIQQLVEEA